MDEEKSKFYTKSSMLYWYPKIKDLPIPQPKTIFILQDDHWWDYLDGRVFSKQMIKTLKIGIANLGGTPVFMRTDLASGKHQFVQSSFVDSIASVSQRLYCLIEQNATHSLLFDSIVIREYITLNWKFKAFNGLPIASERRYFIKDGQVQCHHPYWPEQAIKFYGDTRQTWKNTNWSLDLENLNFETAKEIETLTEYAELVGAVLSGSWSVDFVKSAKGVWYLIDMALAEESWHPEHADRPQSPNSYTIDS